MEFAATRKRSKKWKKKRHLRKRLRDRVKVEIKVRSTKHQKSTFSEYTNVLDAQEALTTVTMQADAFWKNYAVGQEWQKRHNITWWRSRCMALEYENEILRDKVKSLVQHFHHSDKTVPETNNYHEGYGNEDVQEESQEDAQNLNSDSLELNVTEDMLNFFEQSERHRREMKRKHKSKKTTCKKEITKDISIVGGAQSVCARKKTAELLYGDASSKILAMETALQTTVDNYIDKFKPQHWPNIPFNP